MTYVLIPIDVVLKMHDAILTPVNCKVWHVTNHWYGHWRASKIGCITGF